MLLKEIDKMRETDNRETFNEYGIRNTKQRNIVFNILKNADTPLTAEEIFIKTQGTNDSMNFSTIYRILNTFVSKNMALKRNIGEDEKSVFELNLEEHSHYLICISCKKMIKIEHCPLEEYEGRLQNDTKFHIMGHKLEVYGHCPACICKKEEENACEN